MPDRRAHRGPGPHDHADFGAEAIEPIRRAVAELSWLLSRGYAWKSSLKLVGDRHALTERQRNAAFRASCPDEWLARRQAHRVELADLAGSTVLVDGFNLLTTVEAALGGAPVFRGLDGCLRDLAGVHGTYRKVDETRPAVALVGAYLARQGVARATWCLDRPVSNSGRLAAILRDRAEAHGWAWEVELLYNPDDHLAEAEGVIVATADGGILNRAERWVNLAAAAVAAEVPGAWVIDLAGGG